MTPRLRGGINCVIIMHHHKKIINTRYIPSGTKKGIPLVNCLHKRISQMQTKTYTISKMTDYSLQSKYLSHTYPMVRQQLIMIIPFSPIISPSASPQPVTQNDKTKVDPAAHTWIPMVPDQHPPSSGREPFTYILSQLTLTFPSTLYSAALVLVGIGSGQKPCPQ